VAAVELAFALISRKTLHFAPHHALKMYIEQYGKLIESSVGEDLFRYNGTLFPDTPVVATGRTALHVPQPDLVAYQGTPGSPVQVASRPDQSVDDVFDTLTLWIDNNVILSQGDLQTYYTLLATVDGREIPLPLHTPLMKVDWREKGVFCIQLASLGLDAKIS